MICPQLESKRSENLSQKRITRAINTLGEGVVIRILAFASYLMGWSYEDIARNYGYSIPGLKSLLQQVLLQGVERFVDQRRKDAWQSPYVEPPAVKCQVDLEQRDDGMVVNIEKASLFIKEEDTLARKTLAILLVDSGVLTQKEAAELTGTKPLAVSKNYQAFKAEGAAGLVDKREGQKQEYRFTPQVKGELIRGYSLKALENISPSSSVLAQHLSEVFGQPFSRRSVSYHLDQTGLNLVGPRIVEDTQRFLQEQLKKGLQNSD